MPPSSPNSAPLKVVLLGEGRVGKTSIVNRFTGDTFDDNQKSTKQASMFTRKQIEVADGTLVDIAIWDTAGQERFHALGPIYYRNASGAVLVYDITDPDSFDRVKTWLKELRKVVGDDIRIIICGNKTDLERDRKVNNNQAQDYAASQGATHILTSAKLNKNVAETFVTLADDIYKRKKKLGEWDGGSGDGGSRTSLRGRSKGVKIDMSSDGNTGDSPSGGGRGSGSRGGCCK